MADQIQTRGSTAIKKATLAGAKYRGSAKGGTFKPVKAASSEKALKEKKSQLVQDLDAQARQVSREQAASSLELKLRQQATSGKLRVLQQQEKDALRFEQVQDTSNFAVRSSAEQKQAGMYVAGVAAQGAHQASMAKLISDVAQLSVKFGTQLAVARHGAKGEAQEMGAGLGLYLSDRDADPNNSPQVQRDKTESANFNSAVSASTAAAEKVGGGDEVLTTTLNDDTNEALTYKQARIGNINESALVMGTEINTFLNSDQEIRLRDGTIITPLTMEQNQVSEVLDHAFYTFAKKHGIDKAFKSDPGQVAAVLLPKVKALRQQLESQLTAAISRNKAAERESNAFTTAASEIAAGKDPSEVVQNLTVALHASGGKYTGAKGLASEEAFKKTLELLVKDKNKEEILKLAEGYKLINPNGKPNTGTRWGKIKKIEIETALFEVRTAKIAENNASVAETKHKISEIHLNRETKLDKKNITNDEEVAINKEAIAELKALGTNLGRQEARKLERAGVNYNPNTFYDLKQEQLDPENPRVFTNTELSTLVKNQDINTEEAKDLGWKPTTGMSSDQLAQARLKEWKVDTGAVAKGIVLGVIKDVEKDRNIASEVAKTQGVNIANDIEARINKDMYQWSKDNPSATATEARAYLQDLAIQYQTVVADNIKYDTTKNRITDYRFGGDPEKQPVNFILPDTPKQKNDIVYFDYSDSPTEQLEKLGVGQFNPAKNQVLTVSEVDLAYRAMSGEEGISIPTRVSARAAALNISINDLVHLQAQLYELINPGSYPGVDMIPTGDPLQQRYSSEQTVQPTKPIDLPSSFPL